jgi:multidrug efflux pump
LAIDASSDPLSPGDAIYRASLMCFRPTMKTTCAVLLGALLLAFVHGKSANLRRLLGISIVGGLIVTPPRLRVRT